MSQRGKKQNDGSRLSDINMDDVVLDSPLSSKANRQQSTEQQGTSTILRPGQRKGKVALSLFEEESRSEPKPAAPLFPEVVDESDAISAMSDEEQARVLRSSSAVFTPIPIQDPKEVDSHIASNEQEQQQPANSSQQPADAANQDEQKQDTQVDDEHQAAQNQQINSVDTSNQDQIVSNDPTNDEQPANDEQQSVDTSNQQQAEQKQDVEVDNEHQATQDQTLSNDLTNDEQQSVDTSNQQQAENTQVNGEYQATQDQQGNSVATSDQDQIVSSNPTSDEQSANSSQQSADAASQNEKEQNTQVNDNQQVNSDVTNDEQSANSLQQSADAASQNEKEQDTQANGEQQATQDQTLSNDPISNEQSANSPQQQQQNTTENLSALTIRFCKEYGISVEELDTYRRDPSNLLNDAEILFELFITCKCYGEVDRIFTEEGLFGKFITTVSELKGTEVDELAYEFVAPVLVPHIVKAYHESLQDNEALEQISLSAMQICAFLQEGSDEQKHLLTIIDNITQTQQTQQTQQTPESNIDIGEVIRVFINWQHSDSVRGDLILPDDLAKNIKLILPKINPDDSGLQDIFSDMRRALSYKEYCTAQQQTYTTRFEFDSGDAFDNDTTDFMKAMGDSIDESLRSFTAVTDDVAVEDNTLDYLIGAVYDGNELEVNRMVGDIIQCAASNGSYREQLAQRVEDVCSGHSEVEAFIPSAHKTFWQAICEFLLSIFCPEAPEAPGATYVTELDPQVALDTLSRDDQPKGQEQQDEPNRGRTEAKTNEPSDEKCSNADTL
jgi:hypothetical protein